MKWLNAKIHQQIWPRANHVAKITFQFILLHPSAEPFFPIPFISYLYSQTENYWFSSHISTSKLDFFGNTFGLNIPSTIVGCCSNGWFEVWAKMCSEVKGPNIGRTSGRLDPSRLPTWVAGLMLVLPNQRIGFGIVLCRQTQHTAVKLNGTTRF